MPIVQQDLWITPRCLSFSLERSRFRNRSSEHAHGDRLPAPRMESEPCLNGPSCERADPCWEEAAAVECQGSALGRCGHPSPQRPVEQ